MSAWSCMRRFPRHPPPPFVERRFSLQTEREKGESSQGAARVAFAALGGGGRCLLCISLSTAPGGGVVFTLCVLGEMFWVQVVNLLDACFRNIKQAGAYPELRAFARR